MKAGIYRVGKPTTRLRALEYERQMFTGKTKNNRMNRMKGSHILVSKQIK